MQGLKYFEPKGQPMLFGGKERIHAGGRNIHDFGARSLTPYGQWSVIDPKSETFYPVSPYSYCAGDPINYVDPDGQARYIVSQNGYILNIEESETDYISIVDESNNEIATSSQYKIGTIIDAHSGIRPPGEVGAYNCISVTGDDNAREIFEFFADNITYKNGTEFGLNLMDENSETSINDVFTGYTARKLNGSRAVFSLRNQQNRNFREFVHSHWITETPSESDIKSAQNKITRLLEKQSNIPLFSIYVASIRQYRSFTTGVRPVVNNKPTQK